MMIQTFSFRPLLNSQHLQHSLAPSTYKISVFKLMNHSRTTEQITHSFVLKFISRNRSLMYALCIYKFYILLRVFCFVLFGVWGPPNELNILSMHLILYRCFLDFKMKSENPCTLCTLLTLIQRIVCTFRKSHKKAEFKLNNLYVLKCSCPISE